MNLSEFNEQEYLDAYPDVKLAVENGQLLSGFQHYISFGKDEGRSLLSRQKKVFSILDKNGIGLEIGPSHNPIAPKKDGYNVHILDQLDAKGLRKKI